VLDGVRRPGVQRRRVVRFGDLGHLHRAVAGAETSSMASINSTQADNSRKRASVSSHQFADSRRRGWRASRRVDSHERSGRPVQASLQACRRLRVPRR
jgi:hypothetical protein